MEEIWNKKETKKKKIETGKENAEDVYKNNSNTYPNEKATIINVTFDFKNDVGEGWTKEKNYLEESAKTELIERHAREWLKEAEIDTGKRAFCKDMVFTLNRKRIGFEKGILFIVTHKTLK